MHRLPSIAPRSRAAVIAIAMLILTAAIATPPVAADAATAISSLRAGQSMTSGMRLTSPHGRSTIEIDRSGALVRTTAGTRSWSSGTSTTPVKALRSRLHFDAHGRLVLQRRSGAIVWRSARVAGIRRLVLADDGTLTLVGRLRSVRLLPPAQTSPAGAASPSHLPAPGLSLTSPAQLTPEQQLRAGEQLRSNDGRFRLTMQHDGNLVLTGPSGALWSTRTGVGDDASVTMQPDGNLVVHDAADQPRWATRTAAPGSYLALLDDGDLVVFSPEGRALWASKTSTGS